MPKSAIQTVREELISALLLRAGVNPVPAFGSAVAEAAERRYGPTGCDLRAVAREISAISGIPDPGNTEGRIEAAFSTTFGTSVFDGVVNTVMAAPFRSGRDTSAGWVHEREVTNFSPNRRVREQQGDALAQLPRGGSSEHMHRRFSDAEEYRVHRFSRQFVVDSQDLVNDDVDALAEPVRVLAAAAIQTKLDLIYSALLENAALADGIALFHANHQNLDAAAALAQTTLDDAIASTQKQVENGAVLDLESRYLIVPPELRGTARRLARGVELAAADGNLIVRSEPRLSIGVTDPVTGTQYTGSPTSWYLAVAADAGPTIEFGYIDTPRPRLTSWELGEGQYGKGFAVKWDIGAKPTGFQGLRRADA